MDYIGLAAVVGCYLAIIGMYVWVFRQIQEVKNSLIDHAQQRRCHPDATDLVSSKLCDERVKRIEGKVDDLKENLREVLKTVFAEELKDTVRGVLREINQRPE